MRVVLITGLFYAYFCVMTLLFWSLLLVVTPVVLLVDPQRRRLLNRLTATWGYSLVAGAPMWSVDWRGRERVGAGPYIVVANHQSFADIPVILGLRHPFKFISKASIFDVPVIGWGMKLNEYIPIKRGDPESVIQMMALCKSHIDRGNSLLLFPEGTRSRDGRLRTFKQGAFRLAMESGVQILPVVMDQTGEVIPTSGLWIRSKWGTTVPVRVLEPIDPKEYDNARALSAIVRRKMAEELAEMRGDFVEDVLQSPRRRHSSAASSSSGMQTAS